MIEAQGGLCALCKKPLKITRANCDHINPRAFGGRAGSQAVHISCNLVRGIVPMEEITPEMFSSSEGHRLLKNKNRKYRLELEERKKWATM